jgi:cytochrome P450
MIREAVKGRQPQAIKKINDQYGSLVRIGPNELVTNDPDVLRRIMSSRSAYERGPWYDGFRLDPTRDHTFSMRDDAAHSILRNKVSAGYSGKENKMMEEAIESQVAKFVDFIESRYISDPAKYRPMELSEKIQFYTLDVIGELAFGKEFGYMKEDRDIHEYLKMLNDSVPVMLILANLPWMAKVLQSPVFRTLFPKEGDKLGFGAFIGVAKRIVAERFGPQALPQPDMLGSFIRHGLTQEEAAGEALLQIVAGSDSTASTIRFIFLHLLSNPSCYAKLQREIDEGIASGRISSPIKHSEAREMPYLQAVIKEGLRVIPSAAGAFFKTVPPGGDTIDGKFIPEGTQIGSSPFGIHNSKKIFGPDAEAFNPERWIQANPDSLAKMVSTVDLAFHSGKWQCLGKTVALIEFNKLFVEVSHPYITVDFLTRPAVPTIRLCGCQLF